MKNYKISVTGVTPYMQHRMDDAKLADWEKSRGKVIERDDLNDEPLRKAAYHSYINPKGEYFIPSAHFKQSFVKGGGMVRGKVGNSTRSMKNIVAGMWFISEEEIPFRKFDLVDTRSAVNKNVKARVIVHRPKWQTWNAEFTLQIDNDTLTLDTIKNIIEASGKYIGVGSYRPEHTGEYGRFIAEVKPIK